MALDAFVPSLDAATALFVLRRSASGGLKLYMNAPTDRRGDIDERIQ